VTLKPLFDTNVFGHVEAPRFALGGGKIVDRFEAKLFEDLVEHWGMS
jgi:hypothetical protein